ncbi:ATP synthase subunit e, mitochondrial [Folsomia candida]|uniref:ATP synthase subunit e, mitochondrial n=1 Tax=Folsomia candida TaxID=158441 RepID=UPI000B8FE0A1|nr:ATP synthase subunit e, mitochondrial [Folsomia candida]
MSSAPATALPAPIRPSSLIKVGRWSLLALGIMYGISRQSSLVKKETKLREIEAIEGPAREAKKAAEKARLNREELLYLAKETGTPIPPNF